jgi:uncharacterized protein involved in exopolysaccharide biosynthesis
MDVTVTIHRRGDCRSDEITAAGGTSQLHYDLVRRREAHQSAPGAGLRPPCVAEENELTPAPTSTGLTDVRDDEKAHASSQTSGATKTKTKAPAPPRPPVPAVTSVRPLRRAVRHAALILLLAAVLGAAAGAAGRAVVGDKYTSEAQVLWDANAQRLIDPTIPSADANAMDRQVSDQRGVMLSDVVIAAAAEELRADPLEVREAVEIEGAPDSNLLTVSSTSSSPEEATAVVSALVAAYVEHVRVSGASVMLERAETLQRTVDRLAAEVGPLEGQLAGLDPDGSAFAAVQGRYDRAAARLAELIEQQESYRAAAETYEGQAYALRAATEPDSPSSWSLTTSALVGAALGLGLGACVLALLHSRRAPAGTGGASRPAP